MLIVKADNVLMPDVLKDIRIITNTLSGTKGGISVNNFTNIEHLEVSGDDKIEEVSEKNMEKIEKLPVKNSYYFAGGPFMVTYVSEVISYDLAILIPIYLPTSNFQLPT